VLGKPPFLLLGEDEAPVGDDVVLTFRAFDRERVEAFLG
jgi:hypothetical protein